MKDEDFREIANKQIEWCQDMLGMRGDGYSREGDRFHNFKIAAAVDDETPERALWGMFKKHFVSLKDIVDSTADGKVPDVAVLNEKAGDTINYILLLCGMLEERRMQQKKPPSKVTLRNADGTINVSGIDKRFGMPKLDNFSHGGADALK